MRTVLLVALAAFAATWSAPALAQYSDARSSMNDLQQNALKDGCWKRYSGNPHKRYLCLNGEQFWQNALIDGCHQRYSGNGSKLDRCLNTSNLGGHYSGNTYGNHDGYYRDDPYSNDGYYGSNRRDSNQYGGDNYGGNSGYSSGSSYSGGGLTTIQQNALKDGCWQRYAGNDRKRHACLNGDAHWRDALRDGCWQRYNGNQSKLNRCLEY
ncbi:hypothetical protein [Pyruvatibacter sp.]|uniref:hypothetical protein n=1 Tax=Pyruvatibacter sp. TaxID=1981328 RepID=UPI0032EF1FCD